MGRKGGAKKKNTIIVQLVPERAVKAKGQKIDPRDDPMKNATVYYYTKGKSRGQNPTTEKPLKRMKFNQALNNGKGGYELYVEQKLKK